MNQGPVKLTKSGHTVEYYTAVKRNKDHLFVMWSAPQIASGKARNRKLCLECFYSCKKKK